MTNEPQRTSAGRLLNFSERFEKQRAIVRMLCFETKNLERLMDYTVMSLTNPHTIRGRPTLKDVERFRNGSFHEFCRLKALITLKEVNTSDVETRKNVHEQNFDDEVKNNKQIVVNLPLVFNSLILFLFFMMLDTCNEQLDISYIINIIVQAMINVEETNLGPIFESLKLK